MASAPISPKPRKPKRFVSAGSSLPALVRRGNGEEAIMSANSIHPRSWPGIRGEKKNTCKPHSIVRLRRALAGIERHLETHPRDAAAAHRVGNLKRRIG